jgi:small-conductance mechanosensitive channel
MRLSIRIIIAIFLIALSLSLNTISLQIFTLLKLPQEIISQYLTIIQYIQIALYIIIGLWIIASISEAVRITTQKRLGVRSIVLANTIKYLGYVIVIILVLIPLALGSPGLIAGSAFAGLVLGLALQPVLGNFFAGLLIMLTGYISIGDRVRIIATQIPYFPAQFPAYKYFSADYIEQGFKGTVVEVELFFSRILLDNMRELRIPNIVLLNSAVIDYTSKYSEEQVINVRVELPLNAIDIDSIEELVREELKEFEIAEGPFINEQSDKEHIIILVRIRVPTNKDWREIKSQALKKLLKLRQKLVQKTLQQQ